MSTRTRHARALFAGIAPEYEWMGAVLSFGQDPRWRRSLVSRVDAARGASVLDVASGSGLVARALAARGYQVTSLDASEQMLRSGQPAGPRVVALAEGLPFADAGFAALTFTYLLRYVDDPAATLAELTRVLRPGGTLANLEFLLPPRRLWRLVWSAYTRFVLPVLGRVASPAWGEVGRFLGPSIRDFYGRLPLSHQLALWRAAGVGDVRARPMSFGSGVVVWGRKSRT